MMAKAKAGDEETPKESFPEGTIAAKQPTSSTEKDNDKKRMGNKKPYFVAIIVLIIAFAAAGITAAVLLTRSDEDRNKANDADRSASAAAEGATGPTSSPTERNTLPPTLPLTILETRSPTATPTRSNVGGFQSLAQDSTAVRMDVSDCQSTNPHYDGEFIPLDSTFINIDWDNNCGESIPLPSTFNMDWDNNHTVSNVIVQRDGFVYVQCTTASGETVDCGRVSLFGHGYPFSPMDIFYTFQKSSQEAIEDDVLIISWENVQVGWTDEEYMLNFQVILSSSGVKWCYGEGKTSWNDYKIDAQNMTGKVLLAPLDLDIYYNGNSGYVTAFPSFSCSRALPVVYIQDDDDDGTVYTSSPTGHVPTTPPTHFDGGDFQSLAEDSTAVRMDVADCQSTNPHFEWGLGSRDSTSINFDWDNNCGESIPLASTFNLDWDKNHTVSNVIVQRDGFVYVQCTTASGETVDCGRVSMGFYPFAPMDIYYTFQKSPQEAIEDDILIISWENVQRLWADEEPLNYQLILSSTGIKWCYGEGKTVWNDYLIIARNLTGKLNLVPLDLDIYYGGQNGYVTHFPSLSCSRALPDVYDF